MERFGAGRTTDADGWVTGGSPVGVGGPTCVQAERRASATRKEGRFMGVVVVVLAGTGRGFVKSGMG